MVFELGTGGGDLFNIFESDTGCVALAARRGYDALIMDGRLGHERDSRTLDTVSTDSNRLREQLTVNPASDRRMLSSGLAPFARPEGGLAGCCAFGGREGAGEAEKVGEARAPVQALEKIEALGPAWRASKEQQAYRTGSAPFLRGFGCRAVVAISEVEARNKSGTKALY